MHRRDFMAAAVAGAVPRSFADAKTKPETYVYKTVPGCEIKADVYRSGGTAGGPVLVFVHGGGLILGSRKSINSESFPREELLQHGFTIVSIDYRLAPETKLPGIVEDLQDAWRWIRGEGRERFGIDPNRMAIAGGSGGACLTLIGGFRLQPRPRAIVSYWGYGDIAGAWISEPDAYYRTRPPVSKEEAWASVGRTPISEPPAGVRRQPFLVYCRQQGLWPLLVTGHDPRKEAKWFDGYCTVRNVTKEYPPALLVHGTADGNVPIVQSELMVSKLAAAGVVHEFIRVPGAGHGLTGAKPEDTARVARRALEWVKAHC